MKHTLRDVVKAAEDAGLDAQITIEEGRMCVLATERGPRRDANDCLTRAIITIYDDGSAPGFDWFRKNCEAFAASRLPKPTDLEVA